MATNEKTLEVLTEAVEWLLSRSVPTCNPEAHMTHSLHQKVKSLSSRDSSAGTAEIELCVTCKQRPCGCKKVACDHSVRYVTSTWKDGDDWYQRWHCGTCSHEVDRELAKLYDAKQSPKPAKCEHEAKHVVAGYVSQNGITCVICSRCSTVGKRFDGGTIEWWPSGDERAISKLDLLRRRLFGMGIDYDRDIQNVIKDMIRELGGTT